MQFALTTAPAVFDTRTMMMGRQSAGVGFLRAVLAAKPERLWAFASSREHAQAFADDVWRLTPDRPELRRVLWTEPARLAEAGLLYRADPGIAGDAWARRRHSRSRAYSLCGVTHSLSTLNSMSAVAGLATAPLYSWDAVVCTSTAARDLYRSLLEEQREHLEARLGATRFPLPQLPMIPLGVHPDDFRFEPGFRAEARAALDLAEDDIAVLFAGRLSFHGKAHPMPMLLALEAVARSGAGKLHMLLFGRFPTDAVREAFFAESARFAPSVRLVHLDGTCDENRNRAWAAADIFTSLSDNIQETFGLTPVEGMAAGLPVVVSDWDGYKDTVRDGVDGFRIRTTQPPPGTGADLIDRYDLNIDHYDAFIGGTAQFTAVDVAAATEAFRRLVNSPELRARMGQAGRRRVAEVFDWSVVFRRYLALWDELAERRRSDPRCPDEDVRTTRADRPDPFTLFRSFPTAPLSSATRLRALGASREEALDRLNLLSISYAKAVLPHPGRVGAVYDAAGKGEVLTVSQVSERAGLPLDSATYRTIAWMAKMGLLTFG
jgi:glycosyltransferase involved in cell wall biosynthesis